MVSVTKEIQYSNTLQATVQLKNRGTTQTTKTIEVVTGTTTITSQSVTLNVGEKTTITFSDNTFGETEIGSTRRYKVLTGDREPLIDANIISVFEVPAGTVKEVPTREITDVKYEQTGELHFDQTDELKLSQ